MTYLFPMGGMTHLFPMDSPCAVFISSDMMPGTLGSGRHENNGFLSLEGDWNVCYQAQQLAAVFTDQSGEQGIPS